MGGNLPRLLAPDNPPAVSVVLPVRNGAAFLPATLGSLRHVVRPALEVVVVDDGSDDGTPDLLQAAQRRDPRLRLLRGPSLGLVAALNRGLAHARAPWVARLDADDVLHPDRIARQLALAEAQGLGVVGSGIRCFPTQAIAGGLRRYEAWHNGLVEHDAMARARFVESPLVHPSVLFDRAVVLEQGGYRDCGWPEDYDLWLRLFAAGVRIGKVPELLTFWRDHPTRLTRTAAHCRAEALRACKVHHLLAGPLARATGVWIAGTGLEGKRMARALVQAGLPLRGWLDVHPPRIGQRLLGAAVHHPEAIELGSGEVVLAAVGGAGRREAVQALLARLGWHEGERAWCVA